MPCWEINTITVDLKASDKEALFKALKTLGYNYSETGDKIVVKGTSIIIGKDKTTCKNYDVSKVNAIKRQYSIEIVNKASKLKGWSGTWKIEKNKPTIQLKRW